MKEFYFSKKYFNKLTYDDVESNIRIIIKEIPSLDVSEEDYSFVSKPIMKKRNWFIDNMQLNIILNKTNITIPTYNLNSTLKKLGHFGFVLNLIPVKTIKKQSWDSYTK